MRVNAKEPYSLVYSLVKHPYFGYLVELHAVQLTTFGNYSLLTQKIHSQTAEMFNVSEEDHAIVKLLDEFEAENIVKKFNKSKKPLRPRDFFIKYYNEELHEKHVRPYIEKRLVKILEKLKGKELFLAGKDSNHTHLRLEIPESKASILFHFRR
ncbi:MAG: ATP-dependent helicase, partial [Bacteroidia bacterium]|nr:ATP-dependent helicase [Bacteroidia bacterium]